MRPEFSSPPDFPTRARSVPTRAAATLVAAVVTLGLLAGCSSGSTKASSSKNGSSDSAAAGANKDSGSTAASSGGDAKPVDVCAVIDAAKAKALSGLDITTAVPRTGLQAKEWGCGYSNDDSSVQVQVTVFEHDAASSYDLFLKQSPQKSQLSGVGDKAFFDNDGTLYALSGTAIIQVNGVDTAAQGAALAKAIIAAL